MAKLIIQGPAAKLAVIQRRYRVFGVVFTFVDDEVKAVFPKLQSPPVKAQAPVKTTGKPKSDKKEKKKSK